MSTEAKEVIFKKVSDGDAGVLQQFADAYMSGKDEFWDRNYDYGAFAIGEMVTKTVKDLSQYTGFMDRLLVSRTVKPGEVIRYDKDTHIVGYTLDEYGDVKAIGNGRYIYPIELEVSFTLEFPDEVESGEKLFQYLTNEALQKLITIQDGYLFKLLHYITKKNSIVRRSNFEEMFFELNKEIEMHRIPAEAILLNKTTANKFVKEVVDEDVSEWVDPVVQQELVKAGYLGTYTRNAGAMLMTKSAVIKEDPIFEEDVYALSAPAYIGGAPVRVELFAEPIQQGKKGEKLTKGLFFYKLMSLVVVNPFSVVRGKMTDYQLCSENLDSKN